MKTITLLGSTGSIGRNTLDVVAQHPERYRVHALAAHANVEAMLPQIAQFKPRVVVLHEADAAAQLADAIGAGRAGGHTPAVLSGMEGLLEVSTAPEVEQVVAGMVGAAGLRPVHAALQAAKPVALANKEVMVLAGELMMGLAQEKGCAVLPVDSEHNAVFQCLQGNTISQVEQLILTASGGPFRDLPLEDFPAITREQALAHPNWAMGPKITIDSATMMNKGLEVIEARWLFDLPPEQIGVLIHRQSIVHALVGYRDGSVLAQMGLPDMRTPIAHCLAYPERLPLELPRLNLAEVGRLEFMDVEPARYPCLGLALEALRMGGGMPAALNGANEAVVAAYLDGAFSFVQIAAILKEVMTKLSAQRGKPDTPWLGDVSSVEDAIAADAHGRNLAAALMPEVGTGPHGD